MKREIEKYEKIEQFLSGTLSQEEYKKVEELITSDTNYAQEVARHRQIFNFILNSTYAEIKEHVKAIHEKKNNYIRLRNRIRLGIGIVIGFIIIGVILYFFLSDKKNRDTSIYPVALPDSLNSSNSQSLIDQGIELKNSIKKESGISDPEKKIGTIAVEKELETENRREEILTKHRLDGLLVTSDSIKTYTPVITYEKHTTDAQPLNKDEDDIPVLPEVYDCSEVSISAIVVAEKSCEHESTGILRIEESSVSGGTPPYELSIDNQATYHTTLCLGFLPPNSYSIWIRDINDCCTWLGNFSIETINCHYEDKFAPEKGERWVIPNRENPCRLWIYNQSGSLAFEASFNFPGTYLWDGRKRNGELLPMGVYTFILEIEDETPLKGSVTIIR